ncbi:hypothetical protein AB0O16_07575 [Microbacterium sp. NPDC089180]|uniref:hypothetical protein n=1 Tax=unclassified Microbacterium TaxID=2609290 RepID=UPI003448FD5E
MEPTDPYRQDIARELRAFRKGLGEPGADRLASLFYLTEALGEGEPERAFEELGRLREQFGRDPMTAIGAFFFLSGWGVGLGSVDERRHLYVRRYYAGDVSTPWRRAEKGIAELVALIRNRDESHRPTAFIGVIPGDRSFQIALGFDSAAVDWIEPQVYVNGEAYDLNLHVNKELDGKGKFGRQFVLPFVPLDTSVGSFDSMGNVRVTWRAKVWPVWSVFSWLDDPRMVPHTRTFANKSIEVSIRLYAIDGLPAGPIVGNRAAFAHLLTNGRGGHNQF